MIRMKDTHGSRLCAARDDNYQAGVGAEQLVVTSGGVEAEE
jgi:hypothetical protein